MYPRKNLGKMGDLPEVAASLDRYLPGTTGGRHEQDFERGTDRGGAGAARLVHGTDTRGKWRQLAANGPVGTPGRGGDRRWPERPVGRLLPGAPGLAFRHPRRERARRRFLASALGFAEGV